MYVDKKILEQKADQELELYIAPNNRYVAQSMELAFDILKSRNRNFSYQEEKNIQELIDNKRKSEEIHIHPNHITAGYMIYLSGAIGLGIFIWKFDQLPNIALNIIPFIILCIIFAMGYLIKRGTDWLKYVLLFFVIIGTVGIPIIVMNLIQDPFLASANILQGVLQIWATILLFRIPKCDRNED